MADSNTTKTVPDHCETAAVGFSVRFKNPYARITQVERERTKACSEIYYLRAEHSREIKYLNAELDKANAKIDRFMKEEGSHLLL